jgi:type IV secretion system protein TrbL
VISIASMAIMWAADETNHIWGHLIRKILLVGFWAFIITNWHTFSIMLISGMGKLGISAGGGGGGLGSFLDNPSLVFKTGLDDARALLNYCDYLMGATNRWGHIVAPLDPISWIGFELKQMVAVIEVLIATVIIIFAYGWLALEVVVTVIEFHIVTLVAFCVLPFGVLRQTTSLAENAIAYVFRAGFKAMVLGIIIALGSDVLTTFTVVESPTTLPTLNMLAGLALGVLVILMLALHAPRYASAVVTGAPSTQPAVSSVPLVALGRLQALPHAEPFEGSPAASPARSASARRSTMISAAARRVQLVPRPHWVARVGVALRQALRARRRRRRAADRPPLVRRQAGRRPVLQALRAAQPPPRARSARSPPPRRSATRLRLRRRLRPRLRPLRRLLPTSPLRPPLPAARTWRGTPCLSGSPPSPRPSSPRPGGLTTSGPRTTPSSPAGTASTPTSSTPKPVTPRA